jgi:hypothetical protein
MTYASCIGELKAQDQTIQRAQIWLKMFRREFTFIVKDQIILKRSTLYFTVNIRHYFIQNIVRLGKIMNINEYANELIFITIMD